MPPKFQKNGVQYVNGFYIYWKVVNDDGDQVALFRDPHKAADYAVRKYMTVEMAWKTPTMPTPKTED